MNIAAQSKSIKEIYPEGIQKGIKLFVFPKRERKHKYLKINQGFQMSDKKYIDYSNARRLHLASGTISKTQASIPIRRLPAVNNDMIHVKSVIQYKLNRDKSNKLP